MASRKRAFAFSLCACVLKVVKSMKGSDTVYFDTDILERWYQFGFKAGGSMALTMRLDGPASDWPGFTPGVSNWAPYVYVAACNADQLGSVLDADISYGADGLCWPSERFTGSNVSVLATCTGSAMLSNATGVEWDFKSPVGSDDTYSYLAVACGDPPHHHHDNLGAAAGTLVEVRRRRRGWPTGHSSAGRRLRLTSSYGDAPAGVNIFTTWEFVNPGGEQLSSGDIPLKGLTAAVGVMWGVGVLALGAAAAVARAKTRLPSARAAADSEDAAALLQFGASALSPVRPIHWGMAGVTMVWAVSAATSWRYWALLSYTGADNAPFAVMATLLHVAAGTALVLLMLLLSQGWQVSRLTVTTSEWRQAGVVAALYASSWIAYALESGVVTLALMLLAYLLALRYIVAASASTLALLQAFGSYTRALVRRGVGVVGGGGAAGGDAAPEAQRQTGDYATLDESGDAPSTAPAAVRPAWTHEAGSADSGENDEIVSAGSGRASPWWQRGSTHAPSASSPRSRQPRSLSDRQMATLRMFRALSGSYLVCDVMLTLWTDFTLSGGPYEWAGYALSQALAAVVLGYLLLRLRPRAVISDGPLFDPRGYITLQGGHDPTSALLASAARLYGGEDRDVGGRYGAAAGAGGEYCDDYRVQAEEDANSNIIIYNPDSVDEQGKVVGPVSLGVQR